LYKYNESFKIKKKIRKFFPQVLKMVAFFKMVEKRGFLP
jgi:hypothetical protein